MDNYFKQQYLCKYCMTKIFYVQIFWTTILYVRILFVLHTEGQDGCVITFLLQWHLMHFMPSCLTVMRGKRYWGGLTITSSWPVNQHYLTKSTTPHTHTACAANKSLLTPNYGANKAYLSCNSYPVEVWWFLGQRGPLRLPLNPVLPPARKVFQTLSSRNLSLFWFRL